MSQGGRESAVLLMRHGRTDANEQRRYAGRSPEGLNAIGREQARTAAAALRAEGLGEVWCSDIVRARETAEIVSETLRLPIRVEGELTELGMGPWEGLTEDEVIRDYPDAYAEWCSTPDTLKLPGRETLDEVAARTERVIRRAVARPSPVLLVSHVAPIRVIVLRTLGIPLRYYRKVEIPNTCCLRVAIDISEITPIAGTPQAVVPGHLPRATTDEASRTRRLA